MHAQSARTTGDYLHANFVHFLGVQCNRGGNAIDSLFVDLGMSPLCQTQIAQDKLNHAEIFYPLRVLVCGQCFLVQLDEYVKPDVIFSADYPYFSSYSDSWVRHAKKYVDHVVADYGISSESFVVEIASNDGYLLQHFVEDGIPCLGIEPAGGVAEAAKNKGVPTLTRFFGKNTAADVVAEHGNAQLVLGNNVLAHVPDLNDFVLVRVFRTHSRSTTVRLCSWPVENAHLCVQDFSTVLGWTAEVDAMEAFVTASGAVCQREL